VLRAIVNVAAQGRSPLAPNLASAMFVELPVLADASRRLAEVARRSAAQNRGSGRAAAVVALADHVPWPLLSAAFRAYARAGQQRQRDRGNVTDRPHLARCSDVSSSTSCRTCRWGRRSARVPASSAAEGG
jgi:hypothetical protein